MNKRTRVVKLSDDVVISKMFLIRGTKVMMDNDLAELYKVTTGNLNKAVTRNIKRFPPDFMFQLTREDASELLLTNPKTKWGGTRKLPFVFTEQGVAMLSGILNSERAIAVNIQIMRIFCKVRQLVTDTTLLGFELEELKMKVSEQDQSILSIIDYLESLYREGQATKNRSQIGYKLPEKTSKT
jgi:FtsZ-binding cell division protein ZapB